jgi:hypothetical protein
MRPTDAYTTFEQRYSYPVDRETIIETMGETPIESPTGEEATIAETLEHAETERFTSAQELGDTFFSWLPEQYIGRKYYDDRGDNPHPATARSSTAIESETETDTNTRTGSSTRTRSASD